MAYDLRGAKIIDSRDVIKRQAELEEEREEIASRIESLLEEIDGHTEQEEEDGEESQELSDLRDSLSDAETELTEWYEGGSGEELSALRSLSDEASGYAEGWRYGATLIRDDYFEDYARELAKDIGAISGDEAWPCTCIDWEQAADELKQDYTCVDFAGTEYWVR